MPTYHAYTARGTYQGGQSFPLTPGQINNGWTLGDAPPIPYRHAGIEGYKNVGLLKIDAIKSIIHAPHIWGGGYSPILDTIHGEAIFKQSSTPIALEYDSAGKVFPLASAGGNSAIYIESDALIPDKTGVLFTAKASKGAAGEIMVGLAVNKPDIERDLDGVTQGLVLEIDTKNLGFIRFVVKAGNGTDADFDTDTNWVKFNTADGAGNRLDIDYSMLRKGDSHTFRIESNRGILTVMLDGVKYGTFTYPDATYPLRKFVDGDKKGEMVVHAGFHYSLQTVVNSTVVTGFVFDLHDLCFYQLHPESISHPMSRPDANFVHKTHLPAGFTTANKNDDTDLTYFYMGWREVNDGWLIRRQERATGINTNATTGADDFDTAWENRATLTYL